MTSAKNIVMKFNQISLSMLFLVFLTPGKYIPAQNNPALLAHYMPWYQTPENSGYWGWHWTMDHFDPEKTDKNGRREIASHFYPLTGPYDSQDPSILEYHVLLMKIAGIDGVLVDWYGMEDFWDYGILNESTQALFETVGKANLKFAVVYEDQTVKHMIDNNYLPQEQALAHGQQEMSYLEEHWFTEDAYYTIDNRPVLLNFGPQFFLNSNDWETLFAGLPAAPVFFTENTRLAPVASGAYPWPPMWMIASDAYLSQNDLSGYLNYFYQDAKTWDYLIAGAFPGFMDIYKEAGVSEGYGILDAGEGEILQYTLNKSLENNPAAIQLVTWNDYGEGTMIEPALEYGYHYLEIIQDFKANFDPDFVLNHDNLRLPFRIWELRNENKNDPGLNAILDLVFNLIISEDLERATFIVDSLAGTAHTAGDDSQEIPAHFTVKQNYPNPFNASTKLEYHLSQAAAVSISACNLQGQLTEMLFNAHREAGTHSFIWHADALSSGIYFLRIGAGNEVVIIKCLKVN